MYLENNQLFKKYFKYSLPTYIYNFIWPKSSSFKLYVSEQRDPHEIAKKHMLSWAFPDHICHKNEQGLVPAHMRLCASWFNARVWAVFKKEHKHSSALRVAWGFGVIWHRNYKL